MHVLQNLQSLPHCMKHVSHIIINKNSIIFIDYLQLYKHNRMFSIKYLTSLDLIEF
jgi:hypothetical protein